jgi:hypothetical protein
LFGGNVKDVLLFYIYKEHSVSVYDPDNLSKNKIESAFSSLLGRDVDVLMDKFDTEMKSI